MNMKTREYIEKDKEEAKKIFSQYWNDSGFLEELEKELDSLEYKFYVIEKNNEVVGIAGLRPAPKHLCAQADQCATIELYIVASKYKNEGTGSFLVRDVIKEAKKLGFTEMVCYSPITHNDSWSFYEKLDFKKNGIINDPDDGYPGMLWKKNMEKMIGSTSKCNTW